MIPSRSTPSYPLAIALAGLLALALALSGCCGACQPTPVPESHKELVGSWKGDGITLDISSAGQCSYVKQSGARTEINGPIQAYTDTSFDVGIGPIKSTFVIDKMPRKKKGKWTMTIDGNELTRVAP